MLNLYWLRPGKKLQAIEKVGFKSEDELERYVIGEGKDALSDIFILNRQVRAGGDIPDIVAVDGDNNVVIIENKNTTVDESIVPQLLRYAIWAEKNPDSIKALWLEAENKPDDLPPPDWDNLNIRIIILAPDIQPAVLRFVKTLNYRIELIEVKKFAKGRQEFILMNRLENEPESKKKTVKGLQTYDKEYYLQYHHADSVRRFLELGNEIEKLARNKGWNLEKKFNMYYLGFKHGFPNVFGVHWLGAKSMGIFLKVPPNQFNRVKKMIPYPCEYNDRWRELNVDIGNRFSVSRLTRAFAFCYQLAIGG
jgi:hypothetical protein